MSPVRADGAGCGREKEKVSPNRHGVGGETPYTAKSMTIQLHLLRL
jgi:hypothetical protein